MKYRKKPVVIDAFKVVFDKEHGKYIGMPYWFKRAIVQKKCFFSCVGIQIKTLEGIMSAEIGDYIIKEPFATEDRQSYPCKPDIFEKTYEVAE